MKNARLESRRKKISKDVEGYVQRSFDIVDSIHAILKQKGMDQKDLAIALEKKESEISKWMTGTHNFTLKTITKIEAVLGRPIIHTVKSTKPQLTLSAKVLDPIFVLPKSKKKSVIPSHFMTSIQNTYSTTGSYLN